MKFFKPEDFYTPGEDDTRRTPLEAATIANAKLEAGATVVYSTKNLVRTNIWKEKLDYQLLATHKALLINIKPIIECDHPIDQVLLRYTTFTETGNQGPLSFHWCYKCDTKVTAEPLVRYVTAK